MIEDTKVCIRCKQPKPTSEFKRDKPRKDGFHPYCKTCVKEERFKAKDKIKEYNAKYKKEHAEVISSQRKAYYQEHSEEEKENSRKYYQENHDKALKTMEAYRRAKGMKAPADNIDCSLFLGTHITERAVKPILPKAEHMPNGHPKYDYLCSKGYKVDVKSATTYYYKAKNTYRWMFNIRKNTDADYFLCVAYDNREELNIIGMWMIPGNKINHIATLSISPGSFDKWSEYELDPNETSDCVQQITSP